MRKIFYAAILILFCAVNAHAQNAAFGDTVFGPNVAIKPGASVTVCTHPSTVASCPANKITLYSDVGGSPVTNPLTTDGEGHWLAYAPPGVYDYIVTGPGITPMSTPFTFSIGGTGGSCSTVLQTNGTPNTDQCLLNLHAGTNVTLSNTAGTTTINAAGGGSGCLVPGTDTGVVTEHPVGTCYDSIDFTWDDTAYNLLNGHSASINGLDNYALGQAARVTDSDAQYDYAIGTTAEVTATTDNNFSNISIGDGTNVGGTGGDSLALGDGSLIDATSALTCGGIPSDNWALGDGSDIHAGCDNIAFGDGAAVSNTGNDSIAIGDGATITGTGHATDIIAIGDGPLVVSNGTGHDLVAIGTGAVIETDNGCEDFVFGPGTIDSTACPNPEFSGNFVVGSGIIGSDFTDVEMLGLFGVAPSSNYVGVGLSSTPEIGVTSGLVTLNSSEAVIVANASSTGTTLNKLAKFTGAPSMAVITSTSDVTGAIGIVSLGAGTSGSASISKLGITLCVFDGATTAGDYVNISSSTAGDCHDAGSGQPLYSIGRVMSTNGGGGTYPVDLIIGAGTGGAIATQGKVSLTGQTTSLSPAALITTPASPALAAYRVTAALSCDASSASATVTFTLAWTDPSSTSQSITSSAATCTTLGSASYQSLAYAINVKEGTAINYSTTIANTPTYSLHVLLEGAW